MWTKQSKAGLIRLIENTIQDLSNLPKGKLPVIVRNVTVKGKPPSEIIARLTVYFTPAGNPYCCGEPGCYSNVFRADNTEVGEVIRRELRLRQSVRVSLEIQVEVLDGVEFTTPFF